MSIGDIQNVLLWCAAINYTLLLAWVLLVTVARGPWQRWQSRIFRLSVERLDVLNWAGIALYKLMIIVFNLTPYLALRLVFGAVGHVSA